MTQRQVLFVVHPGSSCRSANDVLGEAAAAQARSGLIEELREWNGGVVIIDGRLSRDMGTRRFYDLGIAVSDAHRRAATAGLPALKIMGCDSSINRNQTWAAREAVLDLGITSDDEVVVTGAWYDPADQFGCVNDVVRAISRLEIPVTVSAKAVRMLPDPDIAYDRLLCQ